MLEATRTHPEILEDPQAYLLSGFRFDEEQLATMLRHFEPFTRKGTHTPSSADPPLSDDDALNA
jgi:hypothetical protein